MPFHYLKLVVWIFAHFLQVPHCKNTGSADTQLSKVHIFWEGHKILRNLHLTFDCSTYSQNLGEDFAKFCGLLRIYELYFLMFNNFGNPFLKLNVIKERSQIKTQGGNELHKDFSWPLCDTHWGCSRNEKGQKYCQKSQSEYHKWQNLCIVSRLFFTLKKCKNTSLNYDWKSKALLWNFSTIGFNVF